ncbi:hypothetical protein IFM89_007152 [Coptis chinensis]|uniref:DUF4283 domain-containing protein n=1 Tax=Coptis chinensis TaxID=261450 RepID=A0A835HB76_9MAGN|nr:hypothetical protein IFM89_007152 [Coptis chinensis]
MSTAFGFGNGRNQSFYPATTLPVASRNQPTLPRVTAVDPREASNGSRMISFADKRGLETHTTRQRILHDSPKAQSASNALIWVKFPKLSQQYWDYELLLAMGKTLGAPVGVDRHTIDRDFGFFASMLVEIDLSKPIPPQIWVEEEDGISFIQEVEVVKMPKYCPHCKAVGHVMAECKWPILEEVQTDHVEGTVQTTQMVGAGALVAHLDCSDLPSHLRIMTPLGETISVEGEVDNGSIPPDLVASQALVVMSDSQSTGNRASSPRTPNQLPALQEVDKLQGSSSWAEQVEEVEWQVQKKKNPKSKWMEQILSPPHTRARNTTSGD